MLQLDGYKNAITDVPNDLGTNAMSGVNVPLFQDFFQTKSLSGADLILSMALASLVFIAIELEKWFIRCRVE